jgi:hypothetical protein
LRPAPAALALSARAFAWLLKAYPAAFRQEYGGEMTLVFGDCCHAEWRAAGPLGLCRLLGRTVVDTLASAPALWVERLEETMKGLPAVRSLGFWLADHGLAVGGLALLVLGASAWPLALTFGWVALGVAFFAWVAETEGLAVPRPGRVAIRTLGCWESPLAFIVRRGDRVLFFVREDDPQRGGFSDTYTVHDQPNGTDFAPCFELPMGPTSEWSVRGWVPVADLHFEHRERVSYVTRGSLDRALAHAGL